MPHVVDNEQVWMVDVDDSLVLWDFEDNEIGPIPIICPYDGTTYKLLPHSGNIRLLKEKKARGAHITVWSQGGWKWAEAVVKALCLMHHVDIIQSKPIGIIDDLPSEAWMPKSTYIPINSKWKASGAATTNGGQGGK